MFRLKVYIHSLDIWFSNYFVTYSFLYGPLFCIKLQFYWRIFLHYQFFWFNFVKLLLFYIQTWVDCVWNVMTHAQKTDLLFRRNGQVHLNRQGLHLSRLLAAEVCASAVVMLDTLCSEVMWRVLATHSIRQFLLHISSRASPCAIMFQLDSNTVVWLLACCNAVG
jgi:hypothetical protein